MKKVAVIICAAGASNRFGGNKKKPFVEVAGRAAFLRSIDFFADRDDVKQTILAIPPEDDELVRLKWGANLSFNQVKICHGGPERFETVANALKLVADDIDLIAVHDAVRCCLKTEWVDKVITQAAQTRAAILACPVVATIKKVSDNKIVETVDRTGLYEVQTPQVFDTTLLKKAYKNIENVDKSTLTDDSALVEAMGKQVTIVQTDSSNIKITHKSDIPIAEAIIKSRPKARPEGPIGPYVEAQW
ncbi:MAG TPA: 2-C-methyl-D-erythritol 4-phosphate cytidylyltransferase [Planctomycetes bacterium]|nr:2-C-methyl-D-erythritol 4-phosphate cytidylyltransferase [Planctomycetota bacterium]HIJ71841.1 2-C-methyl-D-erythritol 4-phosphate cytidylyltransferase [Planctomycetota bacterium]